MVDYTKISMEFQIDYQVRLFKTLLNRELTKDEIFLIKNSFMNGYSYGRLDERSELSSIIQKYMDRR